MLACLRRLVLVGAADNSTTAIHMMVRCQTERPVKGGDTETAFPGLALILRYKPDLEAQIGDTDTPLAMAVHSRNLQKIKMLVSTTAIIVTVGCIK